MIIILSTGITPTSSDSFSRKTLTVFLSALSVKSHRRRKNKESFREKFKA